MKIFIDGDGCPVVDETVAAARKYRISCFIVCDTAHHFDIPGVTTIMVSQGPDSVDFALVNKVETGDIVVTQDYGLAALALAKKAVAINQNGLIFDDTNIDALLHARHTARELRSQRKRFARLSKRTSAQNQFFRETLEKLLFQHEKKNHK